MPPTREEILKRLDRLPEPLREAARKALTSESNTPEGPAPRPAAPPSTSWPGYLWYLNQLDQRGARQLAREGKYWRMNLEERRIVRERAGWSHADVVRERNALAEEIARGRRRP